MFENLKAFIRHGKQANELKKKNPASSVDLATHFSNTLDVTLASVPITNSNDDLIDTYRQVEVVPASSSTDDTAIESLKDYTPNQNEEGYSQAASHIVEQERRQRQKSVKYPNLDNYEVLEQMGEGAFSIVYKANHLPSGKQVAIKILRKFQMDSAQKQAVLKEATIMRQLNHPNIVKFIEFIDSDIYYYIVQELAPGGEIFTAIVNYTYLSEELSRHVIVQVAHAVRYLHEEVGIVHRDIKPENLLFTPIEFRPLLNPLLKLRKSDDPKTKADEGEFTPGVGGGGIGQVKLADFGLSKQIWEHNTKTPCGTVGYTAPEIVRDEKYSKEVDMWALGCVLYTLLCGFPPFYDERIDLLTEKVARGEYTFLKPWWDEISPEAKHCVSKLLTVDPSKRYTIDDLLNDPWITNERRPPSLRAPEAARSARKDHPIQSANYKYSKKFINLDLYLPAAVALRDAFDISTAVHRMGEEKALARGPAIQDTLEEEDEDDDTNSPHTIHSNTVPQVKANVFDLNLGGASILERRKNKPLSLRGSA